MNRTEMFQFVYDLAQMAQLSEDDCGNDDDLKEEMELQGQALVLFDQFREEQGKIEQYKNDGEWPSEIDALGIVVALASKMHILMGIPMPKAEASLMLVRELLEKVQKIEASADPKSEKRSSAYDLIEENDAVVILTLAVEDFKDYVVQRFEVEWEDFPWSDAQIMEAFRKESKYMDFGDQIDVMLEGAIETLEEQTGKSMASLVKGGG